LNLLAHLVKQLLGAQVIRAQTKQLLRLSLVGYVMKPVAVSKTQKNLKGLTNATLKIPYRFRVLNLQTVSL
jgi:hypothetical protein